MFLFCTAVKPILQNTSHILNTRTVKAINSSVNIEEMPLLFLRYP